MFRTGEFNAKDYVEDLEKCGIKIENYRYKPRERKIITLCGSTRFKDLFFSVAKELTLAGNIVLMPMVFHHADNDDLTEEQKIRLDNLHKLKINMSDAIYVINYGGYIGKSTYGEIDWASKLNKQIFFLESAEQTPTKEEAETKEETEE